MKRIVVFLILFLLMLSPFIYAGGWGGGGGSGASTSGSDNEVLTDDGSTGITSESNLTFDGSTLTVTGDVTVNGSGSYTGTLDLSSGGIDLPSNAVDAAGEVSNDVLTHAQIADADQADTKCIWFESPTISDDFASVWANKTANDFLLTELWAESDQTVLITMEVDDGTPASVDTAQLTPSAGEAEDTSLDGDTTVAAGEELDLKINDTSGTPTWVSICFTGNWVD